MNRDYVLDRFPPLLVFMLSEAEASPTTLRNELQLEIFYKSPSKFYVTPK